MNKLPIIEFNNKRVLTTQQIANGYGSDAASVTKNFNNNKSHFREGKHFFLLEGEKLKLFKNSIQKLDVVGNRVNKLYLWTEKGALLLAKSIGTDKAWETYEILVDNYFQANDLQMSLDEKIATIASGYGNMRQEIGDVKEKVEDLSERFGLPATNAAILSHVRNGCIVHYLGGKDTKAYQKLSRKVFSEFGRDFKEKFEVPRYDAIPLSQFDEALAYTKSWQPSFNTKEAIRKMNLLS